ncbi:DUF4314 domain-containing protein [Actinomadura sp. 6K520]|nr:DUF4314 domain-containing protein [Actinomadura sp. 6K520]
MHLGDDRTRQVIDDNLRAGALLTCHATLPYGDHPHFGPAVCAGFWARHHNDVSAGRLAQLVLGIVRVQPPRHEPDQEPAGGSPSPPPPDQFHHHTREEEAGPGPYPRRGDQIRLIATSDPYTVLEQGTLGTVTGVDSRGTIHVRWDNGSTLGLLPGLDRFDIINP